jgi:AcrR family transcriptional regulator
MGQNRLMPTTSAPSTARARARAELTHEITEAARRQLAEVGAAGLSLRAVARELGMVSSAVYRYYPSRDELLTALIVDAYDAVGAAVEEADAAAVDRAGRSRRDGRDALRERWSAVGTAVRSWAVAHPNEYALIYGSPVPGYAAPADTIAPAARPALAFLRILADGVASGAVDPQPAGPIPRTLRADLASIRDEAPGVPDAVLLRGLLVWTQLFGAISFELFGHLHNVIHDYDALFAHHLRLGGDLLLGGPG